MRTDEKIYEELCEWLDTINLSRPKKNLTRDFSDGLLMAELLKSYYPRLVELHNYSPANSVTKKIENWDLLNKKVLRNLGIPQTSRKLKAIAECTKGEIESLLLDVKKKLESDEKNKNGILYRDDKQEFVTLHEYNKLNDKFVQTQNVVDNLRVKIHHLETLMNLKDQRINDLNTQLRRYQYNEINPEEPF